MLPQNNNFLPSSDISSITSRSPFFDSSSFLFRRNVVQNRRPTSFRVRFVPVSFFPNFFSNSPQMKIGKFAQNANRNFPTSPRQLSPADQYCHHLTIRLRTGATIGEIWQNLAISRSKPSPTCRTLPSPPLNLNRGCARPQ